MTAPTSICAALAVGLLLLGPAVSHAQPQPGGAPQIVVGAADPAGWPVTVTWTPSPTAGVTYSLQGAYGDGSGGFTALTPGPSHSRVLPFHASGGPSTGWMCERAILGTQQAAQRCNAFSVPAKPVGPPPPPPPSSTVTVEYTEPTTNADGTPLTDLAGTTVFYRLTGGLDTLGAMVPATAPTGGQRRSVGVTVSSVTGTVTVWAVATDAVGNVSARSTTATMTLGGPVAGKAGVVVTTVTE